MVFYAPEGQPTNPQFMPPKKRSGFTTCLVVVGAIVVGLIGLVVLIGILVAVFSSDDEATSIEQTNYAIGQPVTSGNFEYVVTDFNCGIPSVGEHEITMEVAKGQFCQLSITAKNIVKQAEKLDYDDFRLISDELQFSTDSWVNITSASGAESGGFRDKINPGIQATGNLYFDVPVDVIPDLAVVYDSLNDEFSAISLQK